MGPCGPICLNPFSSIPSPIFVFDRKKFWREIGSKGPGELMSQIEIKYPRIISKGINPTRFEKLQEPKRIGESFIGF